MNLTTRLREISGFVWLNSPATLLRVILLLMASLLSEEPLLQFGNYLWISSVLTPAVLLAKLLYFVSHYCKTHDLCSPHGSFNGRHSVQVDLVCFCDYFRSLVILRPNAFCHLCPTLCFYYITVFINSFRINKVISVLLAVGILPVLGTILLCFRMAALALLALLLTSKGTIENICVVVQVATLGQFNICCWRTSAIDFHQLVSFRAALSAFTLDNQHATTRE